MDRIATLLKFLQDNPADSFVQHALGLEYVKRNEYPSAVQMFENLLTQNPEYVGTYYHLAKTLEKQGNAAEAIKWYLIGMEKAREHKDQHTYNELEAAYEDLTEE